jgi:hypothetical protein
MTKHKQEAMVAALTNALTNTLAGLPESKREEIWRSWRDASANLLQLERLLEDVRGEDGEQPSLVQAAIDSQLFDIRAANAQIGLCWLPWSLRNASRTKVVS